DRLVVRSVERAEKALRAGDYAQVEHSAQRALRGSPRHRYGRFFLSVSLLSQGRLKESIRENERLLSDHPDFDEGWLQLANAYETAGDPDRALTAYNRLVERANDPALRSLAKERRARLLGEGGGN
ncbi:MAG: tetratricopeptide repeat protein, partial [Candidatus Latescibacterota bacterium]